MLKSYLKRIKKDQHKVMSLLPALLYLGKANDIYGLKNKSYNNFQ